jgi:hypothetical protein
VARRAFDCLKDVRQMEFDLDFARNKASREVAALKEVIQKLQAQLKGADKGGGCAALGEHGPTAGWSANKENVFF